MGRFLNKSDLFTFSLPTLPAMILPLMTALWFFLFVISIYFYGLFLANGELGLVELLTNVVYIALIYYAVKWGRRYNISRHLVYALILLAISLPDRELNFQRRIATLFVDVEYYRSYIQLWTHLALYLPLLYFSTMAAGQYRLLIKPLVFKCVPTVALLAIATVVSQIADKTGDDGIWLALEETLKFMIPCLLTYLTHRVFMAINEHQPSGKVFQ